LSGSKNFLSPLLGGRSLVGGRS